MNTALKKAVRIASVLLVSAIIIPAFTSCSILLPKEQEPLPPPLAEPPEPSYNLYTVKRMDLVNQIQESGIFIPVTEYPLSFGDNSGRIAEINIKSGEFVRKGDLLAKLDVEDLEYNISQMEIELKKQKLSFEKMNIDYEKLLSDIKAAKAALAAAQDEEARRQAQASLDNLERQRQKTDIDIEIYKLNLKQQETNLERAKQRLENALLRSPINGIVSFAEGLDPGDWVDSNRTICTVVDPTNLYLRLNSTSVSGLYMGMAADVEINGETYKGTVVMTPNSTSQQPSDQRLRNAIILTVDDLPLSVLPGDQAIVRVLLEQRSDALVIPKAGLRTYGSRNYVLVREGDKNREVDIDIGMQTATYLEVISGLEEGDVIILR